MFMTGDVLIPYIWAATGIVTLIFVVIGVYWASKHHQFDEDISKQIFSEGDDERFD
jgi:uncharacterized membrane protein